MDARKELEKSFHDDLRTESSGQRWSPRLEDKIRGDRLWRNLKYYAIERQSRDLVIEWFRKNCPGKRILDYCCGNGEDSVIMASSDASCVVGIDISDISIENCRSRSAAMGARNVCFKVMDAEALEFDDNSFDVVSEYGALHHLDLEKAYSEISRVLREGGQAICVEALGHNAMIHLYRKLTPCLRTKWEVDHILRRKDIERAKTYFGRVDILGFFHMMTLLSVPFRRARTFSSLLSKLERLDSLVLKLPGIKWWAWQIVFALSEPRKV